MALDVGSLYPLYFIEKTKLGFIRLFKFRLFSYSPIFDVVGVPVMRDSEIMYAEDLQQEGSQCASSSSSSSHKGMDLLERDQVFSYSEP